MPSHTQKLIFQASTGGYKAKGGYGYIFQNALTFLIEKTGLTISRIKPSKFVIYTIRSMSLPKPSKISAKRIGNLSKTYT